MLLIAALAGRGNNADVRLIFAVHADKVRSQFQRVWAFCLARSAATF